jgi:periplasmic protein TonB
MMSSSVPLPPEYYRRFHGWATSVAIHMLAGGLIFLMADRLTLAPAPEPFTWNVVVQASPSSATPKTTQAEPELATPSSPPITKSQPTPTRDTAAHVSVVQRSQPRVDPQPVIREQIQETRPVEHSTPNVIEQQTVRTPSPTLVERRTEPLNRPVEPMHEVPIVETVSSQLVERPIEQAPAQNNVPPVEEIPRVQQAETVHAHSSHVTEDHPVIHDVSPVAEREPVIDHVVSSRETVPSQSSPVVTREIAKSMETTEVEPRVLTERSSTPVHEESPIQAATEIARLQPSFSKAPGQAFPAPQADYGWLVEALRSKVQELKRYPSIARMNNWEGRVVLRAVIKDNGELAELEIAESSGHAALDAAAIEAMKRASPLKLPHPLGRSHVVLHVPIRYHLR